MCEKFYDKLQKQLFTNEGIFVQQELWILGAGEKSGQCGGCSKIKTSTSGVKFVIVCANGPKHQDV